MTKQRHLLPRPARLILGASIAAAVASMFVAPPANSEESAYESIVDGELGFSASALAPGADVTVFADVFGALASVEFELTNADTGAVLMREQLTTDANGSIQYSFKLPSEMITAQYRAEISGLTEDGALVGLEKRFDIIGNVTELQTTTVATTAPPVGANGEPTVSPEGVESPTAIAAVPDGAEGGSDAAPGGATGEVAAGDFADTTDTDPASSRQAAVGAEPNAPESASAAIWIVTAIIVAGLGAIVVIMRRKSSPA